jgi:hypothetical protein
MGDARVSAVDARFRYFCFCSLPLPVAALPDLVPGGMGVKLELPCVAFEGGTSPGETGRVCPSFGLVPSAIALPGLATTKAEAAKSA